MALPTSSLVEQMSQLDAARNLVLGDAVLYPQIVHGILPLIGANARLELQRWGAEFLAETFSSPAFAQQPKQKLASEVLQPIQDLLNIPGGDLAVVRSAIQAAASVYALIFRHIVDNPAQSALWETMTAIKHTVLQKWDTAPQGVKICCVKFVQKVVQVQTHGLISDPRRPEKNETSLALVPRNHPLLILSNLEAEASGLLDRLLNVFHENSSDPILVNATLNCLTVLIRSRQSISNKIINAILDFNPFKQATTPLTPTARVNLKSMERTARALLIGVTKKFPNHPLAARIQQHIEKIAQSRNEIFEEAPRKRALPAEPTDVVDSAKRARLGVETPPQLKIPPLPAGPTSFAQLFTLTEDVGLTSFDVKQLPVDLIVKIAVPILSRIEAEPLDQAIGAVRSRYLTICKKQVFEHQSQAPQPTTTTEEEDDYEPEYQPMDITEAPTEQAEPAALEADAVQPDIVSLGTFVLPKPPPLSEGEVAELGKETIERIFSMITTVPQSTKPSKDSSHTLGFGRLAGSSSDRESSLTLFTRLATRASSGLETDGNDESQDPANRQPKDQSMPDTIREMLYRYVLEDFRVRINVAISWMNEEWYNDRVQLKHAASNNDSDNTSIPNHYNHWAMRLLEGILPYLDARDKVLLRFLSELPELNHILIQKVKTLANDPERVNLCVQALHYLILVRPPAREVCLDALEDLYQQYEEARPSVTKVLLKWRPNYFPDQGKQSPPNLDPGSQNISESIAESKDSTSSPQVPENKPNVENTPTPLSTAHTFDNIAIRHNSDGTTLDEPPKETNPPANSMTSDF